MDPLLRKMVVYISTENHKRPPHRGVCIQGPLSLGSPIQCNKHILSTYCEPDVLSGFGYPAELDRPGLCPWGASSLMGKDRPCGKVIPGRTVFLVGKQNA